MSWGEIYNTSWWGIALDTARTVKARPDFFGSQLNLLTSEQPNLVVNGTFDDGLNNWTNASNWWSVVNGQAYHPASTSMKPLYQDVSTEVNKKYKISVNVNIISGTPQMFWDKVSGQEGQNLAQGLNEIIVTTFRTNSNIYFGRVSPTNAEFYIDNVSVQLVRAELDQIEAKKCLADWTHTTALKDLNN